MELDNHKVMFGTLAPMKDVDVYEVKVPGVGYLEVTGKVGTLNIDLGFGLLEKYFEDNANLEYVYRVQPDASEVTKIYYVYTPGTYYIPVLDIDQADNIDNNGTGGYFLRTSFGEEADNTPPEQPDVLPVTSEDTEVTVQAEMHTTVTVSKGKEKLGSDRSSHSVYAVEIPKQKPGTVLSVTSTDGSGNVSKPMYVTVTNAHKDTTPPSKPIINKVSNKDKVVTGKAEADSTVTVKAGTKTLGSAKTSSKGTYSVSIPVQSAGTTLSVTAKDASGNLSSSATVKVSDAIPPNKPTINKVDNNDKVVTGKAEANSTVVVKVGSKTLGSAKTSSKGVYSVNIPVQNAGAKLSVIAKDAAGNTSAAATTTVVDVVAPNKPTVNKVDDNDKFVTGKAEANSTVTVNVGKNRIGYAKANSKGSFSVAIPVHKKGTTINVTAKDASNNVSKPTYVTVVKH